MTNYEVTESDIDASLEYLGKIYSYSTKKQYDARGIDPVLIGGWAVHAYNPWFGSLDIDLISNSKVTGSLKYFLKKEGFKWGEIEIGNKILSKPIEKGRKIIIDMC